MRAIDCYKKAFELDPTFAHAAYKAGSATLVLGRLDEADPWFDKTIELMPGYATAWDKKGDVRMFRKQYEEALNYYERAVRENPHLESPLSSKGKMLAELQRYEEAVDAFDQCSRLHNNEYLDDLVARRALSLLMAGRFQEANKGFTEAVCLCPRDYSLRP